MTVHLFLKGDAMVIRKYVLALLCCLVAAVPALGANVPVKAFTPYAVSNQHPIPPGQDYEFLYIDNFNKFNQIFVLTVTMGPKPDIVTEDLFNNYAILAVIRPGLWSMEPEGASTQQGNVDFAYSCSKVPATFEAVTPLIVAIPKGVSDTFRFIENGKPVGVVTNASDLSNLRNSNPDVPVLGGWSGYRELDQDARALFQKATRGLTGTVYEPLMFEAQLVNGVNYRFVCVHKTTANPPTLGIALISFHTSFDDRISQPEIQNIIQ